MRFLILLTLFSLGVQAEDPAWFQKDEKGKAGWSFYCKSSTPDEKTALGLAQGDCARKMCLLFGVVVKYTQEATETLKDATVNSKVIESCPDVRIVGRVEKKKLVDCEENNCTAYVSQFYPMKEYELEKKRLDNPPIAPELAKTIIVREGNDTFLDPAKCRASLKAFSSFTGVGEEQRLGRVKNLKIAQKDCKDLDYRNFNLQSELTEYLTRNISARGPSTAQMVLPLISGEKPILEKISALLETEGISQEKSLHRVKRLLEKNYDSLWVRGDIAGPYLNELKTCRVQSDLIRKWPRYFSDEVTVCYPNSQHCQTTSILFLRASYASCVCRVSAPQMINPCTSFLMDHMRTECPGEMTEECFRNMSSAVAEKMKITINEVSHSKGNP